jgi:stearoyl-CoA desaturase (delta-9 desaturase)
VHRKHHAFTDTDNDPHSPAQIGWLRVQFTNFWLYKRAANDPRTVERWGKDLAPDRFDKLLFDKGWLGLLTTAGILCGCLGLWLGLLAFGFHVVSYVMLSGAVNAVGHTFGSRPSDNSATNLHWLAAVTSGEGYHNNHHDAPTSAQFGRRWFDLDAAWWLIKVTEKLGISDVRKVGSQK